MKPHTLSIDVQATLTLEHVTRFIETAPDLMKDKVRELVGTNTEAALHQLTKLSPEEDEADLNRIVEIMDSKGYALVTESDLDGTADDEEYLVDYHPDRCLTFRIPSGKHAGDLADAAQLQDLLGRLNVSDALALLRGEEVAYAR